MSSLYINNWEFNFWPSSNSVDYLLNSILICFLYLYLLVSLGIFLYILGVSLTFNLLSICLQNLCTTFLMTNSCLTCYKIFLTISYIIQVNMNSYHLLTKICWWFGGLNCSCHYFCGKDRFWYSRPYWQILMPNPHTNPPPLFLLAFFHIHFGDSNKAEKLLKYSASHQSPQDFFISQRYI